jgi:hypothetical protein
MSDHPLRGLGIFCEDARGSVGHCEVQPSELHSTVPPSSAPPDADLSIWLIERGNLTIEQNNGIHAKFGAGVIINAEGRGADARVQVNFRNGGMKWLALEYAKLAPA